MMDKIRSLTVKAHYNITKLLFAFGNWIYSNKTEDQRTKKNLALYYGSLL